MSCYVPASIDMVLREERVNPEPARTAARAVAFSASGCASWYTWGLFHHHAQRAEEGKWPQSITEPLNPRR